MGDNTGIDLNIIIGNANGFGIMHVIELVLIKPCNIEPGHRPRAGAGSGRYRAIERQAGGKDDIGIDQPAGCDRQAGTGAKLPP